MAIGLLIVYGFAPASAHDHANHGTIKVHDSVTSNPQGNEPHLPFNDVWVQGAGMSADSGTIVFYSHEPTGDGSVVLTVPWTANSVDRHGWNFLDGPFSLPAGHYRVEAFTDEPPTGDEEHFAKAKMFWTLGAPSTTPPATSSASITTSSTLPSSTSAASTTSDATTSSLPTTTSSAPPSSSSDATASSASSTTSSTPATSTSEASTTSAPPSTSVPVTSTIDVPTTLTIPTTSTTPTLACPASLAAMPQQSGAVMLTWKPAAGSDGTNVYRGSAGGDLEYVTTVANGIGTYTDASTEVGTIYEYYVATLWGDAESLDCGKVQVTSIPEFPSLVAGAFASAGGIAAYALFRRTKP